MTSTMVCQPAKCRSAPESMELVPVPTKTSMSFSPCTFPRSEERCERRAANIEKIPANAQEKQRAPKRGDRSTAHCNTHRSHHQKRAAAHHFAGSKALNKPAGEKGRCKHGNDMDPSRKSGGALHRLHCFCLEFDGACEVQRRVPTDWIIEPIDVSGYGSFSLAS